jgi:hypothetical protein
MVFGLKILGARPVPEKKRIKNKNKNKNKNKKPAPKILGARPVAKKLTKKKNKAGPLDQACVAEILKI